MSAVHRSTPLMRRIRTGPPDASPYSRICRISTDKLPDKFVVEQSGLRDHLPLLAEARVDLARTAAPALFHPVMAAPEGVDVNHGKRAIGFGRYLDALDRAAIMDELVRV